MVGSLAACGGGANSEQSNKNADFTSTIEGRVIKGPISMAEVKAFSIDENGMVSSTPIGQTFTDTDGAYRLNLGAFQGALQVVATMHANSTMRDEATGSILTPPAELTFRAVTVIDAPLGKANFKQHGQQNQTVTISPLTELTTIVASELGRGKLSSSSIRGALAVITESLGFDPVGALPVESTSTTAAYATPDRRMGGLALAAVSWLAKHGTLEDPQMQLCLQKAKDDSPKRVVCAASLIGRIMDVDPTKGTAVPNRATLALTTAIKQVEKDPQINKTAMTLSVAPAMVKLEQRAAGSFSGSQATNNNGGAMSGITAAKKLLESLRSNANAINIGMNEEGISSSLTGLGQSFERAGTMALDVGTLVDMVNDGIVHWNDFRTGLKSLSGFTSLPPSGYGSTSEYFGCTIYSSFLPENLLQAIFGPAPKGVPYVKLSPTQGVLKTSTVDRMNDPRLLVDSTLVPATQGNEARWLGCTRYSKPVASFVQAVAGDGVELNTTVRYRQSMRMLVDAQDSNGRPTRISYIAMTTKQYSQQYSSTDPWMVTRRIDMLDVPLQGFVELTWDGQKIASASISGDLPPSVDDTMMRGTDGLYASRDQPRAARYSAEALVSFVYNDTNTRIDLPKLSLGLVQSGATVPDVRLETDPEGMANYMIVPKSIACSNIPATRLNISSRIKTPLGGLRGQVYIVSPPDCGNTNRPVNGSIEFRGVLNARANQGQEVEVTNASLRVTSNIRMPTVLLEGRLFIPAREPMDLSLSVSATEATPTVPGTLNAQLAYKQAGYSLMFNALEQENYWGGRSGAFFSMTGSGGVSAAWGNGDKTVYIKENGKSIGEIDTQTGRVLFNDGSFQLIR